MEPGFGLGGVGERLGVVCIKWFESESATFCWIDSMLRNYWRFTQAREFSIDPALQTF
jgi:hypothetical protein